MKNFIIAAVVIVVLSAVNAYAVTNAQVLPWVSGVWVSGGTQLIVQPLIEDNKVIICLDDAKLEADIESIDWVNRRINLIMPTPDGKTIIWTIGYRYDHKTYLQLIVPDAGSEIFTFARNLTKPDIEYINGLAWY